MAKEHTEVGGSVEIVLPLINRAGKFRTANTEEEVLLWLQVRFRL